MLHAIPNLSVNVFFKAVSRREQILVTDICLNIDNIYSSFSERAIPDDVDRNVLVKGKAFSTGRSRGEQTTTDMARDPPVEFLRFLSVKSRPSEDERGRVILLDKLRYATAHLKLQQETSSYHQTYNKWSPAFYFPSTKKLETASRDCGPVT
jgi:hypothetical protein